MSQKVFKTNGNYLFLNDLTINDKLEPKNYFLSFENVFQLMLTDAQDFKFPNKIFDFSKNFRENIQVIFNKNDLI